jgi:prepilin-type N-terminal cleavage/methylation domain-containing protein
MDRLRQQSGWTLIELLLAMTLMLIVLGATLNSFDGFVTRQAKATRLQDQQDAARIATDRLITQLRNLANPVVASQTTIDTAEDFKLIFQTTDPAKQWVMYCVDPAARTMWYQVSAVLANNPPVTAAMRASGNCPSPQQTSPGVGQNYWATTQRVSGAINNGASRPVFSYTTVDSSSGAASLLATPVSTANKPKVNAVSTDIWIDNNPADKPPETETRSGVYLRNQNQAPTARFGVAQVTGKTYTFTASASSDPEQRTLQFNWYRTPAGLTVTTFPSTAPKANCPAGATCLPDCPSKTVTTVGGVPWTCFGSDAVVTRSFGSDPTGDQNVWLRVTDPGFLGDFSDLPAGGCQRPTTRVALTDCARVQSGSGP